jgi:antitoxin (DNA-binding transcriptional repressor) of toxin-antitoxin stability system
MKSVTARELGLATTQVLESVNPGQSLVVTEGGVPRWRIEALPQTKDRVAELRSLGRIISAQSDPEAWPEAIPRYTREQVDALYAESRGEH